MARYTGLDSQTYNNMIIDGGEIRLNWTPTYDGTTLAATRGGNTLTFEQEVRDMPVDGAHGPVKGGRRITGITAKLSMNVIEWDTTTIKMALPGSSTDTTTYTGYTMLHRALQIANSAYTDSISLLGELQGSPKPVVITLENALATGNFEMSLTDKDEATDKLEVTAHFLPTDLSTEPWKIYIPKDTTSDV